MARGRMLSKSLSTSERWARLFAVAGEKAEFCQSFYPLLLAHADDFGRLQGDVHTVKHLVLPASPRSLPEVSDALQHMHDVNLIVWYDAASRRVIQIVDFDEHQPGLSKRTKSKFPSPSVNFTEIQEFPSEENRTELNRTEEKKNVSAEPLRDSAPSAAITRTILTFPTTGPVRSWELTEAQIAEWVRLFPNLDVMAECRKALAWIAANPTKQKTARGMPAFIVRWLSNTTDRRPMNGSGANHEPLRADPHGHIPPCQTQAECIAKRLGRTP
jgi:hypothetical protein